MKHGLYVPNFGAFGDARRLASLAREAEQAGWEGFFLWDHIARPWATQVVDPWAALSAIALNTTTLRLGTLVTPLPRRRPWKVARESASLDHLSGGRLVLGVGIGSPGGQDVEWNNFAEEPDLRTRAVMLDEGLEILKGLWSGVPFSFAGRHYQVKASQFVPAPVQSPRIPVWVAGNWPNKAPFRRAARWDGAVPQVDLRQGDEIAQLKAAVEFIRAQRTAAGPFDIVYSSARPPATDPAQLRAHLERYAEAGATWWLEQLYPQHFGSAWQADWPLEAMRRRVQEGPPAP